MAHGMSSSFHCRICRSCVTQLSLIFLVTFASQSVRAIPDTNGPWPAQLLGHCHTQAALSLKCARHPSGNVCKGPVRQAKTSSISTNDAVPPMFMDLNPQMHSAGLTGTCGVAGVGGGMAGGMGGGGSGGRQRRCGGGVRS